MELGTQQNPQHYHDYPTSYERAYHNVTVADATRIIDKLADYWSSALTVAQQNQAPVTSEIGTMMHYREEDPVGYAQRCIIFAITSPGCKFADNVTLVRRTIRLINEGYTPIDQDDLYQKVFAGLSGRSHGRGCANLFQSWDWIISLSYGEIDLTKDNLMRLRADRTIMGIGQKTASMAAALWNPEAKVFTLDVHMLRGFCTLTGDTPAGSYAIADKAYTLLETYLAEKSALIGSMPFAIQWTLWNLFGFGYHVTHLPIFE